jgi:hypothetical protein
MVLAGAIAAANTIPTVASQVAVRTAPPMVVDASVAHPVLAGGIAATARVHGDRAEILALIQPQASIEANRAATDLLAARLRAALPGFVVTSKALSRTSEPGGMQIIDMVTAGGAARVAIPGPLDDAKVRAVVDRARAALDATPATAGMKIHDVALGIASCAALDAAGDADATAAVADIARALGDAGVRPVALADRTTRPVAGRTHPLCGLDAHAQTFQLQRTLSPTTATEVENRRYAFSRALVVAHMPSPAAEPFVPDTPVGYGPAADVRVRVAASGATLTVAGYARAHIAYAGDRYIWTGPNGRTYRRERRSDMLDAARARLRAAGIHDDAIVTQLDPVGGSAYVEVRTADGPVRDDVVAAIAGERENERHEVRFLRYRDTCSARGDDLHAALADAVRRARDVARALRTTADVAHPIAIDLVAASAGGLCATTETPPYDDRIARHVDGSLALPSDEGTVGLTLTVPIGTVVFGKAGAAPQLAAGIDENVQRDQLAPPALDYPQAVSSGAARVEVSLPATQLAVTSRFDPDSEHGFRNVDAAIPRAFGMRIGATPANSSTTRVAIQNYADDNETMSEWRVTSLLDAQPGIIETIAAANSDANRSGNVWTDVLPERSSCVDAALALGVRAIRFAAAVANRPSPQRVVAIDLAGPFAIDGRCNVGPAAYERGSGVRHAKPAVRLAAYARVSYR